MANTRIDTLRNLVADIGKGQTEYWLFFPQFADRLESELGEYLGASNCVALSSADGDFSFDHGSYHQAGLGFESGRFRIPLMFRLKNLNDDGDFLVRIRAYFTLQGDEVVCQIEGQPPLHFTSADLTTLLEYIYRHLCSLFAKDRWFEQPGVDYGGSAIGFGAQRNAT